MSVSPEDLEKQQPATEDEFEVEEVDLHEDLESASTLLKKSAILFEYLSDPDLVKTLTKRERSIIDKQLDRIYTFVERVDETLEELSEL